jgi:asparagine synthase (glutamine-hydrolysing)
MITDEEFTTIAFNARGHNVPQTKEEAFYRQMFWELFRHRNDHIISEIWRPRWTTITDPSARQLSVFTQG